MKSVLVYALLAQSFANVAYARHDCQSDSGMMVATSSVSDTAHAVEQAHAHADSSLHHHTHEPAHSHNCVCPNGHAPCSSVSMTLVGASELVPVQMQGVPRIHAFRTRPFPAHLSDFIRPPIALI